MKCKICGNAKPQLVLDNYKEPDKYERWVGLDAIYRSWIQCDKCKFIWQVRNYPLWELECIYKNGYRSKEFRGESIENAFNRIMGIANSENETRYLWFAMNTKHKDAERVLDIGAGIGVWPAILERAGYNVSCVEENVDSVDFIYRQLGIKCFDGLVSTVGQYDTVSLIHVLEHIEDPVRFLKRIKQHVRPGGYLFVEVPDAAEFGYLPPKHDEFNSCHVSFYDPSSLYKVLDRSGYDVTDIHRVHYEKRNLSRIMCLARY